MIRFENLFALAEDPEKARAKARQEALAALRVLSSPAYDARFCEELAGEIRGQLEGDFDMAHGLCELVFISLAQPEEEKT
jgi:hypothetical protein